MSWMQWKGCCGTSPSNICLSVPTDPIPTSWPWAPSSATPSSPSSAGRSISRITGKGTRPICSRTLCVMGKAALAAPPSSLPGNARGSRSVPSLCSVGPGFPWDLPGRGPGKLRIQRDNRLGSGGGIPSLSVPFPWSVPVLLTPSRRWKSFPTPVRDVAPHRTFQKRKPPAALPLILRDDS